MAQETLVEKLNNLTGSLLEMIKSLNLFALVQKEDQENWDLVISSKTFANKEKDSLKEILILLQDKLTDIELKRIARVVLLNPDNELVKNINKTINMRGHMSFVNAVFNNMVLKRVELFYSSDKGNL